MLFNLRILKRPEIKYVYRQTLPLDINSGAIGYLRVDMGSNGDEFNYTWTDLVPERKTEAFLNSFKAMIEKLRDPKELFCLLSHRNEILEFCQNNPAAKISPDEGMNYYGFRIDLDDYVCLFKVNPDFDKYNIYCYAFEKNRFEAHLQNAEKGVRITNKYRDIILVIVDGGRVRITSDDEAEKEEICRYVDDYNIQIGTGLYSIKDFGEIIESRNLRFEAVK